METIKKVNTPTLDHQHSTRLENLLLDKHYQKQLKEESKHKLNSRIEAEYQLDNIFRMM